MGSSDTLLARFMALHPKLIDLSLGRILTLLERLGDPHKRLPPVIHVAGTNGKGSTVAFLRALLEAAGLRVFGSGWVFVTVDRDGKLALLAKPNQDSPLMEKQTVLLGNDVWEHAYYLKYQNRRADYLRSWWNVVNWAKVGERYAAAKAGKLAI